MDVFQENLIALRHAFHRDPELGFQVKRPRSWVATSLRDGGGNRAIGLHADMDALPICEAGTREAGPLHAADYDFDDALPPIAAPFWIQQVRNHLPVRKHER